MAKNHYSILLEQYKLNGKNYQDWVRNLKIILDSEERTYVLDSPYPLEVVGNDTPEDIAFKQKWANDDMQARCLMLASMIPELQRQHENYQYASQIYKHLEDLFQTPDRLTRYSVISGLYSRKLKEGGDVLEHGLKMIEGIERLERFNTLSKVELYEDLILHSLPPSFNEFKVNYLVANKIHTHVELINLLKNAQNLMSSSAKPEKVTRPSNSCTEGRKTPEGKKKKGRGNATKANKGTSESGPSQDSQGEKPCVHCGKTGHWFCKEHAAALAKGNFLSKI